MNRIERDFVCMTDGHNHKDRYEEAICSANYQISTLEKELEEFKNTPSIVESLNKINKELELKLADEYKRGYDCGVKDSEKWKVESKDYNTMKEELERQIKELEESIKNQSFSFMGLNRSELIDRIKFYDSHINKIREKLNK